ncbi:MAG: LysR family transcriptional regulator [Gammaproteobacteria bacterium]|nr:LysR family transcriptional regulator [Gammaproteobacteria bacterium]
MNITFRQLEVFEAVSKALSYTQASKALHLSQPAVSMQIKQLEDNLGIDLFEQMGKQIYLTEAGIEMFRYSQVISQQLDEVSEVLEQLKGVQRGKLTISVASTANYFATRLLAAFSRKYDETTFSLDVTNRETLLLQLDNNEPDLVIMGKPPADRELLAEAFMTNPLVVVAAPDHPLIGVKDIPLELLQEETFVVREKGSGTWGAMQRFFASHSIVLNTGMEMTSNEAIKQAVEAGLGLGIVSVHTLSLELETHRLAILDVQSFPILRDWYLVHRQGKRLSPVAEAFRQFVFDEGQKLIGFN